MTQRVYKHRVRIYYEDTDLSGLVYHSNDLKYFERAREHIIGPEKLARMWNEAQVGFVVYKAEMTFREGAQLGDEVEVRTHTERESPYRVVFHQNVYKVGGNEKAMVEGRVELVCIDKNRNPVRIPDFEPEV
jgi:tol-pal system-associated acyl-CoA thioesterase